jgi:hypothetical protein
MLFQEPLEHKNEAMPTFHGRIKATIISVSIIRMSLELPFIRISFCGSKTNHPRKKLRILRTSGIKTNPVQN